MNKNNKGFTLVELLIVVAVIAILSVIGVTLFANAQKQGRDSKRRADVEAIAGAAETMKATAGVYPTSAQILLGVYAYNGTNYDLFPNRIDPTDPSGRAINSGDYTYTPTGTPPTSYTICALLEVNKGNSNSATPGTGAFLTTTNGTYHCTRAQQ